jgi:type I restriction enzyme M protein
MTRLVDNDEIASKDYTLSVSTYIEQEDKREVVDILVLNHEIINIVSRVNILRSEIDKIIAEIEGVDYE